jgi:hypothetical protein
MKPPAPRLARDAQAVLEKMRGGYVLSGAPSDYGKDFRLTLPGTDRWEKVTFAIAYELFEGGWIKSVATKNGWVNYEPS